jgi:RNA polymerase sigma-70 factor (ECF subfamily)
MMAFVACGVSHEPPAVEQRSREPWRVVVEYAVAQPTDADRAMDRYAEGDGDAFAVLYDALAPRLYGYLVRQTRDAPRAEDLLQQTMLHIHLARDRFIRGAEVAPWAFAIARRLFIDSSRRGKREVLAVDGDVDAGPSEAPSADDVLEAEDLSKTVDRVLGRLPPAQREAFELLKRDGLSVAQAAEVLGTTVSAVKLRAHRAYQALRRVIDEANSRFEEEGR